MRPADHEARCQVEEKTAAKVKALEGLTGKTVRIAEFKSVVRRACRTRQSEESSGHVKRSSRSSVRNAPANEAKSKRHNREARPSSGTADHVVVNYRTMTTPWQSTALATETEPQPEEQVVKRNEDETRAVVFLSSQSNRTRSTRSRRAKVTRGGRWRLGRGEANERGSHARAETNNRCDRQDTGK